MLGFTLKRKLENLGDFLKELEFKGIRRKFWDSMLDEKFVYYNDKQNERFILVKFYQLPKNVYCSDPTDPMKNLKNNFSYQTPRFFIRQYSYSRVIKKLILLNIIDDDIDYQFGRLISDKELGICKNKTRETITLSEFYNNKLIIEITKKEIKNREQLFKERRRKNNRKIRVFSKNSTFLTEYVSGNGPTIWELRLKRISDDTWKLIGDPKFIRYAINGLSNKIKENTEWINKIDIVS